MANWIAPKTDWVASDYFNVEDYNRIVGNIIYLQYLAKTLFAEFDIRGMVEEKTYYSNFYASEMNLIEENIEIINHNTYGFNIGETKEYRVNEPTPNYDEFNRIESASLRIFNALYGQSVIMQHLAITLSRKSLGKRGHIVFEEPIAHRLDYRLGTDKGVKF